LRMCARAASSSGPPRRAPLQQSMRSGIPRKTRKTLARCGPPTGAQRPPKKADGSARGGIGTGGPLGRARGTHEQPPPAPAPLARCTMRWGARCTAVPAATCRVAAVWRCVAARRCICIKVRCDASRGVAPWSAPSCESRANSFEFQPGVRHLRRRRGVLDVRPAGVCREEQLDRAVAQALRHRGGARTDRWNTRICA
jgi:hypothetical protein